MTPRNIEVTEAAHGRGRPCLHKHKLGAIIYSLSSRSGLAVRGQDPPSMRRRHFFLIASLLVVAGALGTLLWLRHRALPEAVRLLPESDAVVFVNVKAIRRVANGDLKDVAITHDTEYEEFIRETGIDF